MLRIIKVKNEHHALGLKVAALVSSLKDCESPRIFQSAFQSEIKNIKTGNHLHADVQYRCNLENEFTPNEKVHIMKGDLIIFIVTK